MGHLTHTGRLGEVMKESVEVVKIAVFNFLMKKPCSLSVMSLKSGLLDIQHLVIQAISR
jgi:ATP-dependent Lon protease